jgi:pimeloyl-ACP methyl ester carboxylesterase
MHARRHGYLHGFGSGPASTKGVHLQAHLAARGVHLELLDVNVPTFETQTYSAVMDRLDAFDAEAPGDAPLFLAGSSMGGYLAARWAELNPSRVEALFLLCPGFDLASRWPELMGAEKFARWEREGVIEGEDPSGRRRRLHWGFVEDSRRHSPFPDVRCPTRIVHGTRDDVVPVELSRRFAAGRDHVELVEVDDGHRLEQSLEQVAAEMSDFLGLKGTRGTRGLLSG